MSEPIPPELDDQDKWHDGLIPCRMVAKTRVTYRMIDGYEIASIHTFYVPEPIEPDPTTPG
jgi:hypothetical protein